MADYEITITMDDETLNALTGMGMKLFAFKAVEAATRGGTPLVWFETRGYSQTTIVDWSVRYHAYSSQSEIISGGRISSSASYAADLGDTFFISSPAGTGVVRREGDVRAITIRDDVENPFTCGISQENPSGIAPICAFPIFSGFADVFIPIEKVLLMFASGEVNTGTVVTRAYSPGVLVDLTGVTSRAVTYNINTQWAWGGESWGKRVTANEDMVPLLIESSRRAAEISRALNANVTLPAGA